MIFSRVYKNMGRIEESNGVIVSPNGVKNKMDIGIYQRQRNNMINTHLYFLRHYDDILKTDKIQKMVYYILKYRH